MIVLKRVIPVSSNLLTVNRDNWIFLRYLGREQKKHIHLLTDLHFHFINFQLNFTEKVCLQLAKANLGGPNHKNILN